MHKAALEEKELTQDTNEPEPQPEISEPNPTTQLEVSDPETTALVPTEPDIIEGEVIEIEIEPPEVSEDHTPPEQKPYWLLIPFTIFCCLVFLAGSFLVPFFTPSATVTIIPVERSVTTTATIQVPGRQLAPLTLMQSMNAQATGNRHQDATRAHGTITFYNGQFSRQTIAAGTILAGASGIAIITDQPAIIPAGRPPIYGQVTVSAHAIVAGAQGNIQPFDIYTACCLTSVLAKNTAAFTGGASAREYVVVTKRDIASTAATIQTSLAKSERAALKAQMNEGEEVITPPCNNQIITNRKPGDEATQAQVTVSETCSGIAYPTHDLRQKTIQMIDQEAIHRLGTSYHPISDLQVSIVHAAIPNHSRGIVALVVKSEAIYVYQLSPGEKRQLLHHVAGRTKQQALKDLLQLPGIQGVTITIKGNAARLPHDPGSITIVVLSRTA